MSKKRRIFDIDVPEENDDAVPVTQPGEVKRRGPMAAAITENAESLRARQVTEAEIRAENDALAHEHVRMKRQGLIIELIPLDHILTDKLTRDRIKGEDVELAELVASIRDVGLSNPIRVETRGDERYELVQGYRRLAAYRQLLKETGDSDSWGRIPAGIMATGAALELLYRRMVDENVVRKDISFAEMAQLALHYAADPGTEETDPDKAVSMLFQSAGYQKRSYIRSFIKVMRAVGDDLRFPQEMPRSLGLALAERLEKVPNLRQAIIKALLGAENRSAADELALLRHHAGLGAADVSNRSGVAAKVNANSLGNLPRAKTMFQLGRPQGKAKCVAGDGRLEIRLDRDFSTIDRLRLEAAVNSFLDELE